MIANSGLLTPREAAKFLSVCDRTLWELTDSQQIKVTWISTRCKRYDLVDLLDYIDRCKRNGGPTQTVDPKKIKS